MSIQKILTVAFIITSFIGISQTVSIQGKVTDAKSGETIPGVKIMVEGEGKGAYTDFEGNYKATANTRVSAKNDDEFVGVYIIHKVE